MYQSRFALLVCAATALLAAPSDPSVTQAQSALARLPLRFEANQGQWNSRVRYAARSGGYTLMLTDQGPAIAFANAPRVDVALAGSNRAAVLEPLDPIDVRTNYFVGNRKDWHAAVANYSRVRYRSVYPGIDLVYYGSQNQLEFDFVLQPGADPNAIRLKFGAGRVRLTPEGDLEITSGGASILQKKPLVYQQDDAGNRHEVAGRYTLLARNQIGVRLAAYDRKRPLVIDPVLVYCTYMGGSATDQITAVKLGANGLLYVAGWTVNGDLPTVDGAYSDHNLGLTDTFVAIIDTTHGFALKYQSYLGGSALDIPYAITADSSGKIYVAGTTSSTNFPVVGSAVQTSGAGTSLEAYVVKIDPALYGGDSLVYSTFLGGASGDETPRGIDVDKNGFIYLIGTTKSTDFPLTSNAYQAALWGPQDTFLVKIDPNSSSLVYSSYLGGELADDGRCIAVAPSGLVYFASTTDSTTFPLASNPYRTTLQGGFDVVVGVMDMTKSGVNSLVYSTYFGGSDLEEVRGMAFDPKGNLVIAGYTLSTDFPHTADAMQFNASRNGDAFVAVVNPLDPPRFLVYSTYLGGGSGDVAYDVKTDPAGNIYVAGYTLSSDFPITGDAPQPQWGGGVDIFLTKFKPNVAGRGALVYSTFFGGIGTFVPVKIDVSADGTAYVAGYGTIGLPTSEASSQGGYGGSNSDGFILVVK